MNEEQKAAMIRHPARTIWAFAAVWMATISIAYVIQTYGFPWLGGWEWPK